MHLGGVQRNRGQNAFEKKEPVRKDGSKLSVLRLTIRTRAEMHIPFEWAPRPIGAVDFLKRRLERLHNRHVDPIGRNSPDAIEVVAIT